MISRTVLIVDDQAFVRQMMRRALTGLGEYQILEAADGLEAIKLMGNIQAKSGSAAQSASGTKIDCIVSDINMLPMNGLEFLKAIRVGLAPIPRNTPVVMLTGHAEKHFIATAIALDANGFLVKPVSANVFQTRIERAIASPTEPKAAADYALLIVPDIEATDLWSSTASAKQSNVAPVRASDLAGTGHGQLPISVAPVDLRIGDRLAEDLLTDEGILVVPGASRVAASLIAAINDLSEVVKLQPSITVYRN